MIDFSNWQEYKGQYIKAYMDLLLKDGTVVEKAWPNNGVFYSAVARRKVDGSEVAQIRRSRDQTFLSRSKSGVLTRGGDE